MWPSSRKHCLLFQPKQPENKKLPSCVVNSLDLCHLSNPMKRFTREFHDGKCWLQQDNEMRSLMFPSPVKGPFWEAAERMGRGVSVPLGSFLCSSGLCSGNNFKDKSYFSPALHLSKRPCHGLEREKTAIVLRLPLMNSEGFLFTKEIVNASCKVCGGERRCPIWK